MSTLRHRMDGTMVLRGLSARTRESYLACVSGLAKHFSRSPDLIDVVEVQAYLLHLIVDRKLAYVSVNQAACASRFFYDKVQGQTACAFEIPMVKTPKRQP